MSMRPLPKFAARWRTVPWIAALSTLLLLATSLGIGAYEDRFYQVQKTREALVQARILAGSVTAGLAFDDAAAVREYVGALQANPEVETAGVYDENGRLVAGYARNGSQAPAHARPGPPVYAGGGLTITLPVTQNGASLGLVYLSTTLEPVARRLARFAGLAVLAVMALVVVGVLLVAHGMMTRANRELTARAREADEANRQLRVQIAERERAEEALRRGQRMEALGRLTGGVAHDFNNILMVASSGLDLIERTRDPERREAIRAGVRQAVERGAGLTRQLLTFARRGTLKPEVMDLAVQVEGMRVLLEQSLRQDIRLEIRLPEGLWPVEADPSQFELALLNLAVNARDVLKTGGRVQVTAENRPGLSDGDLQGDYVRIAVSDDGPGISAEQAALVFEPFFTTKEVGKGTGLGLSQVYGFARGSTGDARIEQAGPGATVAIYLPRSLKTPAPAPQPTLRPAAVGHGRVLMVEDDPGVATMVGEMLRDLGYEVEHAPSAAAALEALEKRPEVDVVFSDMVMPGGMDGIELAHEIGRRRPELPVLLTTGFSPAIAAAQREGRRLLPKPYSIDALSSALGAVLAERRGA